MAIRISFLTESSASTSKMKLGDLLYGRFGDVEVDTVDVVRSLRERERE